MLVGFKPDEVIIFDKDRRIRSDIIVAIYRRNLSGDGEYGALIHPEMLKER
ncbi:MAG TPA: sigma-E processing peptidase SpoIIGA [Clostridia bacterium]|nr:sigma-E processing peptidase SpoIIGA [Clostridia bacterium]